MELLRGNSHLLAEELPNFPADQGIVATEQADLGAAPAKGASVGQFSKAGQRLPVKIYIGSFEFS
jgi:hypothetical protein